MPSELEERQTKSCSWEDGRSWHWITACGAQLEGEPWSLPVCARDGRECVCLRERYKPVQIQVQFVAGFQTGFQTTSLWGILEAGDILGSLKCWSNVSGFSLLAERKWCFWMCYLGCGTLSSPSLIVDLDNSRQSSLFSNFIKNSVSCIVSE